ncbi:MAG: 50S ribosomal protein L17 [Patescibacteria group bacterium]
MRHLKRGRKFHRKKGQRKALLRGLISNLILKEKIETTEAKAKEIKPFVEKLITIAKKQNLAALRSLFSLISKKSAEKLYYLIAPRYKERRGGYLRIIKGTVRRKNDGSRMAMIEFV